MLNKKLIIESNNCIELEYLTKSLASDTRIEFGVTSSGKYTTIVVNMPDEILPTLRNMVAKAIVVSEKFIFLNNIIELDELNYISVAFISALVQFDLAREVRAVAKAIDNSNVVSLSAIFEFQFSKFKQEWVELIDLMVAMLATPHLDDDLFDMVAYMIISRVKGDKSIFLAEYPDVMLTNVTEGVMVDVVQLYADAEFNLINAVIAEGPTELIIEQSTVGKDLQAVLSRLVPVKVL